MRIVPVDLAVVTEEISRRFALGPLTARQAYDVGRLIKRVHAQGAVPTKNAYFEYIDRVPDQIVLASGTDERFWSNESFLMLGFFDDLRDRFEKRGLLAEGHTTPDEFLRSYYAEVRGRVFDLDMLMLGCTTSQLLMATHYGVVVLFEPKKESEAERGP